MVAATRGFADGARNETAEARLHHGTVHVVVAEVECGDAGCALLELHHEQGRFAGFSRRQRPRLQARRISARLA